jgi:heme exporter protein C
LKREIKILFYLALSMLFILLPITIYKIYEAPIELKMGLVQKIFYFHMPSAVFSMVFFFFSFLFSILYLIKKKNIFDNFAASSVEIGVLLSTFVIISGPLWAKKTWGDYWVWDARLTFTLIMWLIYISYLIIRSSDLNEKVKKVSAVLAIMGFVDIPLVHYSSKKWGGMHPIVTQDKGISKSMAPEMATALYLSLLTILLISVILFILRVYSKGLEQRVELLEFKMMEGE